MADKKVGQANIGMDLNSVMMQKKEGVLTYALNALLSGFDGQSVTYQNEQANNWCLNFPKGFVVIGKKEVVEKDLAILWCTNPTTGDCEIGITKDKTCLYQTIISGKCLNFDINHPILKAKVQIVNNNLQVYWTDPYMRYLDFGNLPFKTSTGDNLCDTVTLNEIDCNKLRVQPNFSIPNVNIQEVTSDGQLIEGSYQFAAYYSNALGTPYTAVFNISNPLSIFDPLKISPDFNLLTNKAIKFQIQNVDNTGIYQYITIVALETINNITTPYIVDTYKVIKPTIDVTYTGGNKTQIKLSIEEIFEKFPIYEKADDLTSTQDTLMWSGLTVAERVSFQKIANQIPIQWQTYQLPSSSNYSNSLNTSNMVGYMRDEVYAPMIVPILKNGRQLDAFHIPCRQATPYDLDIVNNQDSIISNDGCIKDDNSVPRWKIYNTASFIDFDEGYKVNGNDPCYIGPQAYGDFGYYESDEKYPCNEEIWGDLAGKPIRFPRFPDSSLSHIHDNNGNIFPIGIKLDINRVKELIRDSDLPKSLKDQIAGFKIVRGNRANNKSIVAKGLLFNVGIYSRDNQNYFYPNYIYNDLRKDPFLSHSPVGDDSGNNLANRLDGFSSDDSKKRFVFHSPDTHFYQPFLGSQLKLETVEYGKSKTHVVEVKKHARYKVLTTGAYATALGVAIAIGALSGTYGVSTNVFNGTAAFTAYQVLLDIMEKVIPRKNYAYQRTSVGEYTNFKPIPDDQGNKIRSIDIASYIIPGMTSAGDIYPINNYQRESSVYLRTISPLPTSTSFGAPEDQSKWIMGDEGTCPNSSQIVESDISAFYGSIKRTTSNLYGPIDSFDIVDTGFYQPLNIDNTTFYQTATIFGGDTYINKFAFKQKMPFFIDNRVGFNDESDVFYNEIPNVSNPIFWMSTDSKSTGGGLLGGIKQFFGVRTNNFDCRNDKFFYQDGKFYLFTYSIPYFYCESSVNVDFRQAYNDKEGDFFPHVGSSIPDYWLQEINTTIQQDNTYTYNKTFSKQNKEDFFTRLPEDYLTDLPTYQPNVAIYSEKQETNINSRINNWLIYRPISRVDFPTNFGKLMSIEGIENRQLLARFEKKSLIYNALLVAPTSAQAVYLGQTMFAKNVPPIDFAETDLGYNGTQHKFFLKTEYGNISADSSKGQIFLMNGNKIEDITSDKYKVDKFFTSKLDFFIKQAFPDVNIDNHFNGIGLHGVYDTKYNRLIITKLDYDPIIDGITHNNGKFYLNGEEVSKYDTKYFCNKSFTMSFDFDRGAWISFHSYLPSFYIGAANYFYSGLNDQSLSSLWRHNTLISKYNNFYGSIAPYIIEYPRIAENDDEILQSVSDYTKVFTYIDEIRSIQTNDIYFSHSIIYNDQQSTGLIKLTLKKKNDMSSYMKYPKYNVDNVEIQFTKSGSLYNYNTIYDRLIDHLQPMFIPSCNSLSEFKILNKDNYNYTNNIKKSPIRGKDVRIRHLLNDRDDSRFVSQFIITDTQKSII